MAFQWKWMGDDIRLYVIGHGSWKKQSIAGVSVDHLAELLRRAKMTKVRVISLVACNAARDKPDREFIMENNMDSPQYAEFREHISQTPGYDKYPIQYTMNSIGANLLLILSKRNSIRTTIYSRCKSLVVDPTNCKKYTVNDKQYKKEMKKPNEKRDYSIFNNQAKLDKRVFY